jgi:quercetin dioxygenase-like cupin family protein
VTKKATETVIVDDARVRMARYHFEPGAETGHHRHGHDYAIVALTDCVMRIQDADGAREVRINAGEGYRRDEGVEHNVVNGGDAPMSFVEIELK